MSIVISQNGETKITLNPPQFRRVHDLEDGKLKYSHSEVVCELENNAMVHVELIEAILSNGDYTVKTMPSDLTFPFQFTRGETECVQWIKRLIFMNFPNLLVSDVYLNENLPLAP